MAITWPNLPIVKELPRISEALKTHCNLVLSAPPGTGKTSLVPLALAFESPHILGKILVLQPRRVSARQSARFMSELCQSPLGEKIGYHIRHETRSSPHSKVIVMTEAILSRMIVQDPSLEGVGAVLIDEFHERSIHTDLAIALLKEVQESLRPDLRICVMSATLKADAILRFLPNSEHISLNAIQHPVEIHYQAEHLRSSSTSREVSEKVALAVKNHTAQHRSSGDILVFLPGIGEIRRCKDECRELDKRFELCELHSQVSSQDQQNLFDTSTRRKPRIIFATNVAETSITLPLIDCVIDSGLMKELWVDEKTGVEELRLSRISQQSAEQRKGRAGRTHAGTCLRLWSRDEQNHLKEESAPEIRRIDLKGTFLMLKGMGVHDPQKFQWFEAPSIQVYKRDLDYLAQVLQFFKNSFQEDFSRHCSAFLFLNPRVALFLAMAHCLKLQSPRVLSMAVGLENLELILRQGDELPFNPSSDLSSLAQFLESDKLYHLPKGFLSELEYLFQRLERLMGTRVSATNIVPAQEDLEAKKLEQLLTFCFYDRLCRQIPSSKRAVMFGGQEITLEEKSLAHGSPFFLALDVFERTLRGSTFLECKHAHGLSKTQVDHFFGNSIQQIKFEKWNEPKKKFEHLSQKCLLDFPLADPQPFILSPAESLELKTKNIFASEEVFFETRAKFAKWITRIRILHFLSADKFSPPIAGLNDLALMDYLRELSLSGIDFLIPEEELLEQVQALALNASEASLLKKEMPHQIEVPSLSKHPLEYSFLGELPKALLRVRLQEVFGWPESPRLAFGKLPLVLELLSPAYKAVQITQDLRSFWAKTYFDVRRELKADYPRHSWPEDPLAAIAQAKGGKKSGSAF